MPKQYADIVWNPAHHRSNGEKQPAVCGLQDIDYQVPAAVRGIDMLLAKFRGESYRSEVCISPSQEVPMPTLSKKLSEAKIAFVTDGGLVPRGNPDNMTPVGSDKFCIYSFLGKDTLMPEEYEVSHQGYDNKYVTEDPNRLVPLDAARKAETAGRIRKVSDTFYSTAGVMVSVENSQEFGRKIAVSLRESETDGVILTSTCGTSSRCGAYIACEIERVGIPVVHVTNLTQISEWAGCSRILRGNNISHVFGRPESPPEQEYEWRERLFNKALELLASVPDDNSCLIVNMEQ